MTNLIKSPKVLIFFIAIIFFIIPFFWMQPGEMDLGGDSNRLYFYDPSHQLQNYLIYAINPNGFGEEHPLYLALPFVAFLVLFKHIVPSSYFIITFINSLTLVTAFLAMFGITKHLLGNHIQNKEKYITYLVSIFVGIYYILSPVMVRSAWDKAILTHLQIFLNPLLFFLFLKFVATSKMKYLLIILIVTFIFSTNFSWAAAPGLLAFYPLALLYLFLYTKFIIKKKIAIKPLIIFIILFFIIHAFHIVPVIAQLFSHSGAAFARSFTNEGKFDVGLNYFLATAPNITLSKNLLGLPQLVPSIFSFEYLFIAFLFIFVIGLFINIKQKQIPKEQKYNFLLVALFLLISIFFVTANVTKIGFAFYVSLFSLPGFSMFRNYYGQWEFIYLFFMSLALGFGLFHFMLVIKNQYIRYGIFVTLSLLVIISAIPFIRGDMINLILNKNQKVEFKVPIKMDPDFEKTLEYIRKDPIDGKYLLFPLTEGINQMLAGTQGGMYQGPSMISALTGKEDFAGYQIIRPFSEIFLPLVKKNEIKDLTTLLSLFNIKYIFYNSDPLIMKYFPDYPYSYIKDFLPKNQIGYQKFINTLPVTKKKDFGTKFHIYEINEKSYLPHIYVAKKVVTFHAQFDKWGYFSKAFFANNQEVRTVYFEKKNKYSTFENIPKITFTKVNPTKYYIKVTDAHGPYALVFSEAFNPNWKIYLSSNKKMENKVIASYFNGEIKEGTHKNNLLDNNTFETWGKTALAENNQFVANGYANSWIINPKDLQNRHDYTFILELTSQKQFYILLPISLVGFGFSCVWLTLILVRKYKHRK